MRLKWIVAFALLSFFALLWWPLNVKAGPNAQPRIPHPLEGRSNCTSCHEVGGPGLGIAGGYGMPDNHRGRTDPNCTGCHSEQAAPVTQPSPRATATQASAQGGVSQPRTASGPPAVPHPLEGRNACTACHQVGGSGAGIAGGTGMPLNHQGRTDGMCTGCHTAALAAASPAPAPAAPAAGGLAPAPAAPAPTKPAAAGPPVAQLSSSASLPNTGEFEDRLALVMVLLGGGAGLLTIALGLRRLLAGPR